MEDHDELVEFCEQQRSMLDNVIARSRPHSSQAIIATSLLLLDARVALLADAIADGAAMIAAATER